MGVGIDISEKVKSQEELAQSEERYRTIIEQASDAIFISDLTGHYLDVNSNGIKLSGYSKEELLNLTIYDLMPVNDMEKNPPKLDEIIAGNVTVNERLFKAKDGSLKEVEISAKLLSDGRFIGIVRDITTRKKTQEALRISEEKYRLLFNQNPMPMWMISLPERKFLDVNSAAIDFYGYSKEEFLGMTAYDIRPSEQIQKLKEFDSKYSSNGIIHAGVWEHQKKDATIVKVNIITHNIFYEGKEARLVLANDVTQKITAEEALKKSHEELRQLATHLEKVRETERTNIAREIHDELGQQLTGLKMDISWLNRKLKNQDEDVQVKINETIQLIDTTVKTVRRIATELRPSILDDLGLLAAMEWQSEEFEKRSEISCVFSSNVLEAKVNPDLATGIFRIYQECLTNVLRHSEATRVTSFLQIKDHILVLTITDNGIGFVEKEIADKKTLGLLGMKERTNLLGGTYEITSRPGKGTSVLIIVPLRDH
jgi:PAS domain S-box-containing protein